MVSTESAAGNEALQVERRRVPWQEKSKQLAEQMDQTEMGLCRQKGQQSLPAQVGAQKLDACTEAAHKCTQTARQPQRSPGCRVQQDHCAQSAQRKINCTKWSSFRSGSVAARKCSSLDIVG